MKLKEIFDPTISFLHYCPGCGQLHRIPTDPAGKPCWKFNGNMDKPTFTPSVHYVGRCHYFIQDGNIAYESDSTHDLKGTTVPLPDIPEDFL